MPCVWSESLRRAEVAPNRIAEGKGARREAGSEGSRRRIAAPTNRNRIEGPGPWGEPAKYGEARKLPGRGVGKSGGERGKETGLTLGGLRACPVKPDNSVSDGGGWARRSQQRPYYRAGTSREGPNFRVQGDRPDDSADVERREGMTDQLSLFGEEAVVRPLGGGEAGSGPAPTGERQASSASEGRRALATDTARSLELRH